MRQEKWGSLLNGGFGSSLGHFPFHASGRIMFLEHFRVLPKWAILAVHRRPPVSALCLAATSVPLAGFILCLLDFLRTHQTLPWLPRQPSYF